MRPAHHIAKSAIVSRLTGNASTVIPIRYLAGEKLAGISTRFSCSTISGKATSR